MGVEDKQFYSMDQLAPYIKESLKTGSNVKLTISGNSMFPTLVHRRDAVELEAVKPEDEIKKHDVVFYQRENGRYVLHRVLKKEGNNLVIAGDGEMEKEYGITCDMIFARMCAFTRKGKYISVNNPFYRIYVNLWHALFKQRYFILENAIKVRRMFLGKK